MGGCLMFCHTVPLLKGRPVHVDVGFVRQVDFTGSFINRPGLVHALRLQVLDVLRNTRRDSCRLHMNSN